jgi:glycosyltransferase involved in cell wall biosynthesis
MFRPPAEFNDSRTLGVAVGPIRARGWRGEVARRTVERLEPGPGQHIYTRKPSRTPAYVSSYDDVWTVSDFVEHWTRRYWGIESSLINPPVDVEGIQRVGHVPKENIILNVGRFFQGHHNKKHLEMVKAFQHMVDDGLSGWTLVLVGGAPDEPEHREYLRRIRAAADGLPIRIANDIPYSELLGLYARGSIYWHATGLGEDEGRDPAAMEHFGITTVEAMAAGCVPVVINRAGQAEIVQHRRSGLLWEDLAGLQRATWELIRDPGLRGRLSEAARQRSRHFSHASFERRMLELVNAILPPGDRLGTTRY